MSSRGREALGPKKSQTELEKSQNPDPPTLAFWQKSKGNPEKSKGFSPRGTPKILGKDREKRTKKQGKSENEKSKEIEKSKDWRVRESIVFQLFLTPSRLRFRLSGPRGREGQGTHFRTLSPTLGPKGPNDPCSGRKFGEIQRGGLVNGGLAQKAPIGPKKALSGEFLLPPRSCEVQRNRSRSAPKRPR